jgi:hypothetical protein
MRATSSGHCLLEMVELTQSDMLSQLHDTQQVVLHALQRLERQEQQLYQTSQYHR